ncbi:DciA family protein [Hydrogenophaga sp. IBVHS2]|uniref:DciA family protein n=1 Tax=Hydrogenophaga sp. IBVHS2 TaxID=1985170 RepID=UPI0015C50BE4|nr:DciA family protein [Hydrogenophaga sp. IBVHS2]
MPSPFRSPHVFSLEEAAGAAPTLAALQERIRQSDWCLQQIRPLMPAALRPHVVAGPLEDTDWCLLVRSTAASTKLRQLLPRFLERLTEQGAPIRTIRLKVQSPVR